MILTRTTIKIFLLFATYWLFNISFSYSQTNTGVPGACGAGNPLLKNNSTPSPLNGNGSMGQSFNQSACGLNYVAFTQVVQTRYASSAGCGTGPCSWSVSGLPPCTSPVSGGSIVYALCSYQSGPPVGTITITNPLGNTQSYSAGPIGVSGDKCWTSLGEIGTAVYRWDVTPSIAGNGNYAFSFSGFSNPSFEIDGATIFIAYRDLNATYDGSLIFWDGAMATGAFNGPVSTLSQTLGGFNVCATPSTATAFMITSDHQNNIAPSHNSEMNGVVYSFPNSFSNFQVKPTSLVAGQTTSAFYDSNIYNGNGTGDCFLWGMAGLYYQSSCTGCTPTGLAGTQSSTPSACGSSNGTATVNPSGGILPYTYVWNPAVAGNTNTANGLAVGSYNVTIYDATGCSTPVTIVVGGAATPAVTATSTQTGCTVVNGTATANPSGGNGAYTYSWNTTPVQNTQTANNLPAGTYIITVTDANSCTAQTSVVVSATNAPTVTASSTQSGCTVANGTATANPSGGTGAYTYSWNTAPVQNTQTANNLSAGIYTVTATDVNGCSAQTSVTVTNTNGPTVTAIGTPAGCTAANGSATATPSGGTGSFTYLWSTTPVQITPTATGLGSGNYTVTVTDANGCSSATTVSVSTTGNVPSTTASANNTVSCFGGTNGSATATPSGGTGAYTYHWNSSPVQNTQTASNLAAGNYSVTVTDANGCTASSTVAITQPLAAVTAVSAQTNVLCNGGTSATATVTPSGGTPGYTYTWNTTPVQSAQTATGLSAGTYTVLVKDSKGCTKTATVTITQPALLAATTTPTNVLCNGGSNGSATATPSGGTPGFTYTWNTSPVQSTQTANNLSAGNYTVTVKDANGCTKKTPVTITQPAPITYTVSGNDSVCKGNTTLLTANAIGGTPAYTYVWNPATQTSSSVVVNPTSSSNYSVAITDANGCVSLSQVFHITVLPAPNALFDTASTGTFGSTFAFSDLSTPSVTITAWNWNFGDNSSSSTQQNPVHTFPGSGVYTITEVVFNQFGCPDTFKITVNISEGIIIPNVFTPDGDGVNDVWYIPNSGMKEFHVAIFDRWGAKVFETTADEIRWDGHSTSGHLLSDGTYYYVLKAILKSGGGEKDYSTTGYVTLLTKKQ